MGFIIKNTAGLVNTRLTDIGREKLSQGNFNISYFQVGDSEVSYNTLPTSYNQFDTVILEPSFNAQNSSGIPQSNKSNVKYPYYVDGSAGNTYGIPFMDSQISPVFNRAVMRGFFTGNTSADTISWSALTNNFYTINANYVVQMNSLVGTNKITLINNSSNPDSVREPAIGDIITIYYDGKGMEDSSCSYYTTPTPTPTPTITPSPTPQPCNCYQLKPNPNPCAIPIGVLPTISYLNCYGNIVSVGYDLNSEFKVCTPDVNSIVPYASCPPESITLVGDCSSCNIGSSQCYLLTFEQFVLCPHPGCIISYMDSNGNTVAEIYNPSFPFKLCTPDVTSINASTTILTNELIGDCKVCVNNNCYCVTIPGDGISESLCTVDYLDCQGGLISETYLLSTGITVCSSSPNTVSTNCKSPVPIIGGPCSSSLDCIGFAGPNPTSTPTPTPTSSNSFPCESPTPTPTPSKTPCLTPSTSRACPLPPPPDCLVDISSCYAMLTYKIVNICLGEITLDRPTPNFINVTNVCYGRVIVYPPNMTTIYDSITPSRHWNDNVINFESVCYTDEFDVKIWNMNIPWSENPAGLISSISKDYTNFGSIAYLGTKEYFGYASSSGQTDSSSTYYFNSFGDKINVKPEQQKAIGIIHYTNQTVDFFYGEKFALEPFDTSNPADTTGEARNFKVHIPWLMWHKNPDCCNGQTFWVDPPGFEDLNLFQVQYLQSTKNVDMNNPGMRYYHLWDTNANANGIPNRVGKVFPDDKLVIIDDEEIIAAMSYKSNRNWTLPSPKISLITPNTCGNDSSTVTGILTGLTESLYVTYRLSNTDLFTDSLHCNYYSFIQGPNIDCSPITSQNVAVRFGGEFGCLNQPFYPTTTTTTSHYPTTTTTTSSSPIILYNFCLTFQVDTQFHFIPNGTDMDGYQQWISDTISGIPDSSCQVVWNSSLNQWEMNGWSGGYQFVSSSSYPPLSGWSVVGEPLYVVDATEGLCVSPPFLSPFTTTTTTYNPVTTTTTSICPIYCDVIQGFLANKFEILCQKVVGNARPNSSEWVAIDFTSQLTSTMVNGYITQEGLTGNTFVITQQEYDDAPTYNLNTYIPLTPVGYTGTSLNFGDEYYFYGSLETDIQATIYEMKYKINLGQAEFQTTSNPTWSSGKPTYVSEIGLYDNEKNLMIISKTQSPVLRQGIQQYLIKLDL